MQLHTDFQTQTLPAGANGRQSRQSPQTSQQKSIEGVKPLPQGRRLRQIKRGSDWQSALPTLPAGVNGRQSRQSPQTSQQKSIEGVKPLPQGRRLRQIKRGSDWQSALPTLPAGANGRQSRQSPQPSQQKSTEGVKPLPQGRRVRLLSAAAVGCTLSVLLSMPEVTLNAAREAMLAWYTSVAPALFPFMALMPMLTCPDAAQAYERLLGRPMRILFNLPGAAAPAVVVGMIAGSPAGAAAAVRTCAAAGLTRWDAQRLVLCCCGLSPAFLITGVGAAMLGSPADGILLLRAQIFAQLLMLAVTRRARPSEPIPSIEETQTADGMTRAVTAVLNVCGYMILFSIAAAVIAEIAGRKIGLAALCLLDAPSGTRALANLPMRREGKLLLIAAVCGFGGGCIAAQNLSAAAKAGVTKGKYLAARLIHAALMTVATAIQLHRKAPALGKIPKPMEFSAFFAAILLIPTLIILKKIIFLTKENQGK